MDHWRSKVTGRASEGNPVFDTRVDSKRPHNWSIDPVEPELFLSKKQAVQPPASRSISGVSNPNVPHWESTTSFHQSVPTQFTDRLFGSEIERPVGFVDESFDISRKGLEEPFGHDISFGLSISHSAEDPQTCLSYSGIQKVKEGHVKDSHGELHAERLSGFHAGNETGFIPDQWSHSQIRSMESTYEKGGDNIMTITDAYGKGDGGIISFGGFSDDHSVMPLAPQSLGSFDKSYHQSSALTTEASEGRQVDASNISMNQKNKSRTESVLKNKAESNKPSKKEAPNSFPSNVRSLISTGMLDGVPIKYVAVSQKELCGIIKGSGYLCGCPSCNYSKVLNAYEFEQHAGAKTKHPNNHIYFENGKTIYQIVQELRSTPVGLLFDTIQTVFGAPINQKSFRIWKESFQAATRELQRIYGKDGFT